MDRYNFALAVVREVLRANFDFAVAMVDRANNDSRGSPLNEGLGSTWQAYVGQISTGRLTPNQGVVGVFEGGLSSPNIDGRNSNDYTTNTTAPPVDVSDNAVGRKVEDTPAAAEPKRRRSRNAANKTSASSDTQEPVESPPEAPETPADVVEAPANEPTVIEPDVEVNAANDSDQGNEFSPFDNNDDDSADDDASTFSMDKGVFPNLSDDWFANNDAEAKEICRSIAAAHLSKMNNQGDKTRSFIEGITGKSAIRFCDSSELARFYREAGPAVFNMTKKG